MGDFAAVGRHMMGRRFDSTQDAIDHLGSFYWEHTIQHDTRILGSFVLMGSTLSGAPRLFQFSPSGSIHEYVAWARGVGTTTARETLARSYRPGSERKAVRCALVALGYPRTYELETIRA
jgi:20S proteasome alpha/beta subunit